MKISKYTSLHAYNGDTLLFNSEEEKLLVLTPALEKVYREHSAKPDGLQQVHPEFFNALRANRFIVADEEDEAEVLISRWGQADHDARQFGIIINPTLNCNMRCWYCYEPHAGRQVMTEQTRQAICRLIDNRTADKRLRMLNVSFFGGEPLLFFNDSVLPILQYAARVCQEKGITLYTNFTTNATLLTDEVIEALNALPLGKKATFQITFDGNRAVHDRTRVGADQKPTYDLILRHLHSALQHGNEVSARLNYTYDNILTFHDVLADFKALNLQAYTRTLSVKFEHVWQDGKNLEKSRPLMQQLKKDFEAAGFNVGTDEVHYRHVCYADSPRHVVVNYNGDVFKCTARDFTAQSREGELTADGQIVWNEKYHQRMHIRYSNPACRACRILPICNGSCTQNKLESGRKDVCFVGMTEEARQEYLEARVKEIVQRQMKKARANKSCPE